MQQRDVAPGIAREEEERQIKAKPHVASSTVRWATGIVAVVVVLYALWMLVSYLNEAAI
jgi:hypothetical protein